MNLAENLPPIWADPSQIEQVIMNLGLNARDAMRDGGHLTITTQERSFPKTVSSSTLTHAQGHTFCSPYPTPVRASRPICSNTSLSPSSARRISARARDWVSPQFMASSNNTRDSSSWTLPIEAERLSESICQSPWRHPDRAAHQAGAPPARHGSCPHRRGRR